MCCHGYTRHSYINVAHKSPAKALRISWCNQKWRNNVWILPTTVTSAWRKITLRFETHDPLLPPAHLCVYKKCSCMHTSMCILLITLTATTIEAALTRPPNWPTQVFPHTCMSLADSRMQGIQSTRKVWALTLLQEIELIVNREKSMLITRLISSHFSGKLFDHKSYNHLDNRQLPHGPADGTLHHIPDCHLTCVTSFSSNNYCLL